MTDVRWIKITTDMFDNRKIRYLRTLPEGNDIVLIWIMLLSLAGKCNADGRIYLTESVPYTSEMLAGELGFSPEVMDKAIEALQCMDMIHYEEDELVITGWAEHQNAEAMARIREQTRERVTKHREKRNSENADADVTDCNADVTDIEALHERYTSVTRPLQSQTEKEKNREDKEREIKKEKEKKKDKEEISKNILPSAMANKERPRGSPETIASAVARLKTTYSRGEK